MRAFPATLTPIPMAASRPRSAMCLRRSPRVLVGRKALLRAEVALESAIAMYIGAKQPLPAPSTEEAGEEIVPLSALGIAKTALYDANKALAVRLAARGLRLVVGVAQAA